MKLIEGVAAIISKDGAYFATQRGYDEFEGLREFPGGKIEPGESCEVAFKREVIEDLGIDIIIENLLCATEYNYPSFHLTMHCYLRGIKSGEIELRKHKSACWLTTETLDGIKWLPADLMVNKQLTLQYD